MGTEGKLDVVVGAVRCVRSESAGVLNRMPCCNVKSVLIVSYPGDTGYPMLSDPSNDSRRVRSRAVSSHSSSKRPSIVGVSVNRVAAIKGCCPRRAILCSMYASPGRLRGRCVGSGKTIRPWSSIRGGIPTFNAWGPCDAFCSVNRSNLPIGPATAERTTRNSGCVPCTGSSEHTKSQDLSAVPVCRG